MEFKREQYLNKLIRHDGNHMIKIITGIRRCGKSYLLNHLFYNDLREKGIDDNHIIKVVFDFDKDIDKLNNFYPETPTYLKDEKGIDYKFPKI